MRTTRLLLATGLALGAVVAVVGALAWGSPATALADDATSAPAAPQALPLPWLSDDDVADAPYGFSPMVDGRIDPGEYAGAGKVIFPGYGGDVEVGIAPSDVALLVMVRVSGQREKDYGFVSTDRYRGRAIGFSDAKARKAAIQKFRQWWNTHRESPDYKHLKPLPTVELPKPWRQGQDG